MVRKSLEELQKEAQEYFNRFNVRKLFATSDGQFFLLQSRADLHARNNLTVYPIEREDEVAEESKKQEALSVKQLIEKLAGMNSLSDVQKLLNAEVSGSNRKTAVAAIEARCREIVEAQEPRT